MQRISIKGVLIGGMVDYVLNSVFFVLLVACVMINIRMHNDTPMTLAKAAFESFENSLKLHYLQVLTGFIGTVIAGYVAARIAKKDELLNGFLAALPCATLAIYRWAASADEQALSANAAQIAISFMCALFGGGLAMARRRAVDHRVAPTCAHRR